MFFIVMYFAGSCSHSVSFKYNCLDVVTLLIKKGFFSCLSSNCACQFDSSIVCARFRSQTTLNNRETTQALSSSSHAVEK